MTANVCQEPESLKKQKQPQFAFKKPSAAPQSKVQQQQDQEVMRVENPFEHEDGSPVFVDSIIQGSKRLKLEEQKNQSFGVEAIPLRRESSKAEEPPREYLTKRMAKA